MLDGVHINLQRVRGKARVAFGPGAALTDLFQQGSAKAMLPKTHTSSPEVVFLNTSGGLTGGDKLSYDLAMSGGGEVTASTQTAERVYASRSGAAEVDITLRVEAGGHLNWLPQETILFDSAALHRTTRIELSEGASCLLCEMLTLGRAAMGETVTSLDLLDRRIVSSGSRPIFVDPLRLTSLDLCRRSPAGIAEAAAFATVALISGDAEDRLPALRKSLPESAAASAWDGKLVVRAMSQDPYRLRHDVASILRHLRGTDLPRVWQI